jgi:cytochrome o ubiquinol oxidase subunit 1
MGAGADVNAFFGIMTMIIAVPTGVKVFNWLFTMYRGRIRFDTPMLWFMGFVVTFTIGGAAGVLLAVPPADFQLHNSLFLVAHFHTMIIGGVVFGYFAGITYWFPKIFGFRLHEGLGKIAFWCWLIGFCLAFIPLYALGLMGATRRLDHYDASLGWQGLFIVAGVGVLVIALGIGAQLLQIVVSILKRHDNRDLTGDPWNGRTLEWSVPSPAPVYNFATTPPVTTRDAFWNAKRGKAPLAQEDIRPIRLPKNSAGGLLVGGLAFLAGFGLIWHIFWLTFLAVLGLISVLLWRSNQEETEYTIPVRTIEKIEAGGKA